jgi:hypothetical protein
MTDIAHGSKLTVADFDLFSDDKKGEIIPATDRPRVVHYYNAKHLPKDHDIFQTQVVDEAYSNYFLSSKTQTRRAVKLIVPHLRIRTVQTKPTPQRLLARLKFLNEEAVDDGIKPSSDSRNDLLSFYVENRIDKVPSVFLLENGNFRAVWKEDGAQIGIQFLGSDTGQFVALRNEKKKQHHVIGVEGFAEIRRVVSALQIDGLWFKSGLTTAYNLLIAR